LSHQVGEAFTIDFASSFTLQPNCGSTAEIAYTIASSPPMTFTRSFDDATAQFAVTAAATTVA